MNEYKNRFIDNLTKFRLLLFFVFCTCGFESVTIGDLRFLPFWLLCGITISASKNRIYKMNIKLSVLFSYDNCY